MFNLILFKPILFFDNIALHSSFLIFNVIIKNSSLWFYIKILFIIISFFSNIIFFNILFSFINKNTKKNLKQNAPSFGLLLGKDMKNNNVYISEKSMYQNILITGSIGSGKTASAMYPITKQLMKYQCFNADKKLGFLILDVKGNYHNQVLKFAKEFKREDDVIVIGLNGLYKYNPLDKPNIKSSVLADRIKSILLLFSPNNSEDYWLDKVSSILECMINFSRIYNDGYVTFDEIHKLTLDYEYYQEKLKVARKIFLSGFLSKEECFSLLHLIDFLENDYFSLDERTQGILKSEITRITNCFVSDYSVRKIFCPAREEQNFYGFKDVLKKGKIVVLNMNIAEYRNLSKVMAAYLKLDFQTDVLQQLSYSSTIKRPVCFISDEYQEYVTSSDASFFSQSREAKCINIVSTQSYTSIINTLHDESSAKVIIQNLINKLWFRTDDIFTIEDIQKQIGKEDKKKISRTIAENPKNSFYSPLLKNFVSPESSISESINYNIQNDFVYDYNFFTQELHTFQCLAFLSDGDSIIDPTKIQTIPYFKNIKEAL